MNSLRNVALGLALCGACMSASAALIVDRGLPDTNLNAAAGADRSNVAWDFNPPEDWVAGDDFTLAALPPKTGWRIDQIRIWTIAGEAGSNFLLGDRFQEVSLFLGPAGPAGTEIPIVLSASLSGTTTDNPDVAVTQVQYATGADYQTSSGAFAKLWQVDFVDVGVVDAGTLLFAVDGIDPGAAEPNWFNHASNAALSGTPQDGSDDEYGFFSGNAADSSLSFGGTVDSDGFGWDKSSDINIQVWATQVHVSEPGVIALALLGIAGVLAGRGRRRRAAGAV